MKPNGTNPYQMARLYVGLTQEVASEKLHIATRTLQGYEAGDQAPNPQMVAMMSMLYGVELGVAGNPATACLNLFKQLDDVIKLRGRLQEIASNGVIWPDERDDWLAALHEAIELGSACMTLTQVPLYDFPDMKKEAHP